MTTQAERAAEKRRAAGLPVFTCPKCGALAPHCESVVTRLQQESFNLGVPDDIRASGWSGAEQAFDLEGIEWVRA